MLPSDGEFRAMAEEFAKLKVRRDTADSGADMPDYCKEYVESCYYTQCAVDSLIRYYFERSGERGEIISYLASVSAKQVIKIKDICKLWFGSQPESGARNTGNLGRAACRQRLLAHHAALLNTLFKIDDICGAGRREALRGIIDRALACSYMCMLI